MSESRLQLALIGDIHAQFDVLAPVLDHLATWPRLDAVLLVGDISADPPWARRDLEHARQVASIAEVVGRITERLGRPVWFVPGNHDPRHVPLHGNIDGLTQPIDFIEVHGIGGAGPARFGFPYEWDEAEIAARVVPACDVLLVHCPPHGTPLDALYGQRGHVGSRAIRAHAERHRGVLVCGHIHESAGFFTLGDCLCINVGALGEPFGRPCVGSLEVERAGPRTTWRATLTELTTGATQTATHTTTEPSP